MNELYKLLLGLMDVTNNTHEIAKANNIFLQNFEQRIAAIESKVEQMSQAIEAMQKSLTLEIPESEPTATGAEKDE